jgi:hypothetical protein
MQNAPPVAYPVGRFSWNAQFALLVQALIGVAGVLSVSVVWPAEHGPVLSALLGGGWIVWLWAACRQEACSPVGTLRWDAGAMGAEWNPGAGGWWWQEDGCPQAVPVARLGCRLDWGAGMLVHGQVGGRTRWFWLSATLAESRWGELRRAVEAQAYPS